MIADTVKSNAVVAAKYSIDDFFRTFLALRKAIVQYDKDRINSSKYDTPCHTLAENLSLSTFMLFCLNNIDCYTDVEKEKVISKANRVAKNCVSCGTVTQDEIDAFSRTELGYDLRIKASLDRGAILAYEWGFLIHYIDGVPGLLLI
jgi:hypothetical protein